MNSYRKISIIAVIVLMIFSTSFVYPYAKAEGGNGIPALISKIEAKLTNLEKSNQEQQASIKNLEETIENQQVQINEQKDLVSSIGDQLSSTQNTLASHQELLNSLYQDTTQNKETIIQLQNSFTDIRTEMDRILERLSEEEPGSTLFSVTGKAQFQNGQPIRFAKVYVVDQSNQFMFQTDWTGEFALIDLPNGEYTIKVGSLENPLMEKLITINGTDQTEVVWTSQVPLYDVSGKMLDVNGKQFYAGVILVDKNNGITYSEYPRDFQSFHFQVPNGTYKVEYHVPGFLISTPSEIIVNDGNIQTEIKVSVSTYSIQGKAIDKDGNPLAFQPISLGYGNGGSFGYNFRTDASGNFAIDGLVDGLYTINIGDFRNPIVTKQIEIHGSDLADLIVSE